MKSKVKITFLLLLVVLWLCSCELIELTQREEIKINASSSCGQVDFTTRNISDRDIHNIRWTASVYDKDDTYLWGDSGRLNYLALGQSFSESTNTGSCFNSDAHCVRIVVKWDDRKGRTCYEWCTVYTF